MAKIVVLGAGISGHTAASHIRRKLGRKHEVVVVSPSVVLPVDPIEHLGWYRENDYRPGPV